MSQNKPGPIVRLFAWLMTAIITAWILILKFFLFLIEKYQARKSRRLVTFWECPGCKFLITDLTHKIVYNDNPCPRCREYLYSQYTPRRMQ